MNKGDVPLAVWLLEHPLFVTPIHSYVLAIILKAEGRQDAYASPNRDQEQLSYLYQK